MTDFLPIVSRVTGVFLVMGVGALARRRHWLTRESDASLANVTANVLLPALFIDRILAGSRLDTLATAWVPPAIGFATTALGFLLGWMIARTIGHWFGIVGDAAQRSFALGVGVCNYGYIPIPLAQYFFPDAEVTLIIHNVGVDLALWSIGLWIIAGGGRMSARRAFLSPPVVAVFVAVSLKQMGAAKVIPAPVLQMTHDLGQCTIPLGLLLSGAIIVDFVRGASWKTSGGTIALAIGFRQGLMPLLMLGSASLMALPLDMKQVIVLQAAMPSAVFPVVLARLYDRDTTTALRVVLGTGIAGILTIPLWLYAGRLWLLGS